MFVSEGDFRFWSLVLLAIIAFCLVVLLLSAAVAASKIQPIVQKANTVTEDITNTVNDVRRDISRITRQNGNARNVVNNVINDAKEVLPSLFNWRQ